MTVAEVQGVLHQAQLLLSEMIHFAVEMAHYLSFEVSVTEFNRVSVASSIAFSVHSPIGTICSLLS